MNLKEWCLQHRTQTMAAAALKISAVNLCRYLAGRKPSLQTARNIESASGGAVTLNDLGYALSKPCAFCGALIVPRPDHRGDPILGDEWKSRTYCNIRCFSDAKLARDICSPISARKRANRLYKASECSLCGSTRRVQRHHRNGNLKDNSKENIQILCQTCHTKEHMKSGTWGRTARMKSCP